MIKVTFLEGCEYLAVKVEGHAGSAEPGKDIVCASASILAYTLASIIKACDPNSNINLDGGIATIECDYRDHPRAELIKNSFDFAFAGYSQLEHNYPQYVRLNRS